MNRSKFYRIALGMLAFTMLAQQPVKADIYEDIMDSTAVKLTREFPDRYNFVLDKFGNAYLITKMSNFEKIQAAFKYVKDTVYKYPAHTLGVIGAGVLVYGAYKVYKKRKKI